MFKTNGNIPMMNVKEKVHKVAVLKNSITEIVSLKVDKRRQC